MHAIEVRVTVRQAEALADALPQAMRVLLTGDELKAVRDKRDLMRRLQAEYNEKRRNAEHPAAVQAAARYELQCREEGDVLNQILVSLGIDE